MKTPHQRLIDRLLSATEERPAHDPTVRAGIQALCLMRLADGRPETPELLRPDTLIHGNN
jgi:hypothetical protein